MDTNANKLAIGERMDESFHQTIEEWNSTEVAYPLHKCLHEFIEAQVARTPNATALIYEGQRITYDEYNRRANRLAHYLISKGIGPEVMTGICAFRSMEMVIGLLAIIKAGGAYVPFDPTYPKQRLSFMVDDSKVTVMLAQRQCEDLLRDKNTEVLYFEDIAQQLDKFPDTNPTVDTRPENLAYMIYTSGSTGNPKGAMNTHRAIVNRLLWMQDAFQIGESDTLIQKTPFSFDVSVWEFFWPFMYGAQLAIAKPEGHKDAAYLSELIHEAGVTVIHFVPSMLRLFLEAADEKKCSSLQHVVLSGEAVTIDLQRLYFKNFQTPLHNLYGPTEAAVDVSYWKCDPDSDRTVVPIGKPISNTTLYILDKEGQPVPIGESGELHIGGVQVARGYHNRPELTAKQFIRDPFSKMPGARMYKTGDLCRFMPDGNIEYIGRIDFQVKIRGNRIELGEIEAAILEDASIRHCAVTVREDTPGEKRLVAYICGDDAKFTVTEIRQRLATVLPDYMVPAAFMTLPSLPLTPSGKTDRRALPKPGRQRPQLANDYVAPRSDTEKLLSRVWCDILQLNKVGIEDNFFDLGGDSLLGIKMAARLHSRHDMTLPVVKLFQYPTIAPLAEFLDTRQDNFSFMDDVEERATRQRIGRFHDDLMHDGIAIIGMAGRFPGAGTIDELWDNLCNGVDSISHFSREELSPGADKDLFDDPDYVPSRGYLEDADKFDAPFFGIGPQEAKVIDPQQRIFLEIAWAALENAGYDTEAFGGTVGVYAGVGDNHYYPFHVLSHPDLVNMVGKVIVGYGNEKDYIATRVSYALNLTGPSVSANTGCSTSLLAVDNAFRSLVNYECDMALAGGIDIFVPQKSGVLYQQGGIFTKDGRCRPFDNDATGTMFCDGAGIVVLKRLSDAVADGDRIYSIIRGTAKNNDGANKGSFLAPSVDGQATVIAMAQAQANVQPEEVSYIEAHGTGTPLGDPIEIEALTKAFGAKTSKTQFCRIGSIKGNIGHPTIASGIAGLIKTSLSLFHEKIPGTLHFDEPNEKIDFDSSPFKVVDRLTQWPRSDQRRIAGVSSFGFGGTNVHTIVEEGPRMEASGASRPMQLLLLSAKTENALDQAGKNMIRHLQDHPDTSLADTAYTLMSGRRDFARRRFVVCSDAQDAGRVLERPIPLRSQVNHCQERDPEMVFMFPGQGSQYVNMGKSLYEHEPVFREMVDYCCDAISPVLGCDLRDFLYPADDDVERAAQSLKNTFYTQPAIFIIEYSLARLLMHWGIRPSAMIGHSVGEFVCACLSGVFTLDDALRLVAMRGKLIQDLPPGSMLSVRGPAEEIEPLLPENIQLAAANSPTLCVVSGPAEAITAFKQELEQKDIACKQLHTSHAFHSAMMDPVVDAFTREVASATMHAPEIPFISTVTTRWITEEDATSPQYWGRHLRMPVRFSNGIQELLQDQRRLFVEVGPRSTCATLVRQHGSLRNKIPVTPTLADTHADNAEWIALLGALGYMWMNGVTPDWKSYYGNERRQRIPLPSYPFERHSYWLEPLRFLQSDAPQGRDPVPEPAGVQPSPDNGDAPTAPDQDAIVERLVAIISETAGISLEGVDLSTTFLELGMDSLLLSQLAYKLKTDFGLKMTFNQLMREYATIPLLAEVIRDNAQTDAPPAPRRPDAVSDEGLRDGADGPVRVPVTVPQKGLWISSKLSDELSCAYNESITLDLTGELDVLLMEQTAGELVKKHDALRATFSTDGTEMLISDDIQLDLRHIDLQDADTHAALETFKKVQREDASTPFDLEHGPLFRCYIVAMPQLQWYVVFTSHHIVCDGWSLDVLIEDFCDIYQKISLGESPRYGRSAPYAEFVSMVVHRQQDDEYIKAKKFWLDKFREKFPVLRLPADHPERRLGSYQARRLDHDLEGHLVQRLRRKCKQKGWSPFAVFVAAYKIMLHKVSGQKDFVVGLPLAEQPLVGQEALVGHCVNLLPLWCPIDDQLTYDAYVDRVQHELLESYDYQSFTFVDLLNQAQLNLDHTGHSPMTAGLTTVKKYEEGDLSLPNAKVDYFPNPRAFESFELYLNVVESFSSIELKCHFKSDIFEASRIGEWLRQYEEIVMHIVSDRQVGFEVVEVEVRPEIAQAVPQEVLQPGDSQLAAEILAIWKKVFRNDAIGYQDNFFEIGGHSLLAAQLFAEIERKTGQRVPLSVLYEANTVLQLAAAIEKGTTASQWQSLVPIRNQGDRPPLYLVHGAEGDVLMYRDLARHLGDQQPVYGIQAAKLEEGDGDQLRIEDVASNYIREIRMLQPKGPYYLGGYCLGGTIALEMAQQLHQAGEEIGMLVMIENYNIRTIQWPLPVHLNVTNKFLNIWNHVANLCSLNNNAKGEFFKKKAQTELSRFKVNMQVRVARLMHKMGLKNGLEFHHTRVDKVFDDALAEYDPKVFDGKLVVFGAEKRLAGFPDSQYGWGEVARQGVEICEIPIKPRGSMVEPYVGMVGERLLSMLENQAQGPKQCCGQVCKN